MCVYFTYVCNYVCLCFYVYILLLYVCAFVYVYMCVCVCSCLYVMYVVWLRWVFDKAQVKWAATELGWIAACPN